MKFALCFVALFCLTSSQLLNADLKLNVSVKLDAEIVLGTIDEELLLTEEVVHQEGQLNRVVSTFASFHGETNVVITAVQIIPNLGGSQITLTSGGLGQNFITLRVDSELGKDIEFTFRVYGKRT